MKAKGRAALAAERFPTNRHGAGVELALPTGCQLTKVNGLVRKYRTGVVPRDVFRASHPRERS